MIQNPWALQALGLSLNNPPLVPSADLYHLSSYYAAACAPLSPRRPYFPTTWAQAATPAMIWAIVRDLYKSLQNIALSEKLNPIRLVDQSLLARSFDHRDSAYQSWLPFSKTEDASIIA